jgi:thiosulfate/3-mercaptopyruvate sulfurtransferase
MPVRRTVTFLAALFLVAASLADAQPGSGESLLISSTDLQRQLGDPALVLLHVGPKPDYDAGHIAGARFVQMQDVSLPRVEGQLSLELPPVDELRTRLERLGIGDESRIVVVPGEDWASPSTRVVFALTAAGLGTRTRLLDGGMRGWKAAGLPVTTDVPPAPRPGHLTVSADRSVVADHAFLTDGLASHAFKLVDARAPMFYDGPGMRENGMNHGAGHIASAVNIPFNTIFDDQVRLMPRDELRRRFAEAGIRPGDAIVAYCHVGQQATAVVFAARVLGHPVKLYDGSMDEWEKKGGALVNERRGNSPSR